MSLRPRLPGSGATPSSYALGLTLPGRDQRGDRLAERAPPVPDGPETGPVPAGVAEDAVAGPRRRTVQRAGGDRPDPGRIGAGQAEDLAGQAAPGRLPRTRRVIDARRGGRLDQRDDLGRHIGRPGWLAALVVDHVNGRPAA